MQILATLSMRTRIGYLQYGTGVAALVSSSKVRVYGTYHPT
jgi:hypothetical protein